MRKNYTPFSRRWKEREVWKKRGPLIRGNYCLYRFFFLVYFLGLVLFFVFLFLSCGVYGRCKQRYTEDGRACIPIVVERTFRKGYTVLCPPSTKVTHSRITQGKKRKKCVDVKTVQVDQTSIVRCREVHHGIPFWAPCKLIHDTSVIGHDMEWWRARREGNLYNPYWLATRVRTPLGERLVMGLKNDTFCCCSRYRRNQETSEMRALAGIPVPTTLDRRLENESDRWPTSPWLINMQNEKKAKALAGLGLQELAQHHGPDPFFCLLSSLRIEGYAALRKIHCSDTSVDRYYWGMYQKSVLAFVLSKKKKVLDFTYRPINPLELCNSKKRTNGWSTLELTGWPARRENMDSMRSIKVHLLCCIDWFFINTYYVY